MTSNQETVTFQIGEEGSVKMTFKMNVTDPVMKAINAYAKQVNKEPSKLRFMYEGQVIDHLSSRQTPLSLDIEEGGLIEVFPVSDPPANNQMASKTVSFNIEDEDKFSMNFKMSDTDPIVNAINAYTRRVNKDVNALRFTLDGSFIDRLTTRQTPRSLGIEDGDIIEVNVQTDGGFRLW